MAHSTHYSYSQRASTRGSISPSSYGSSSSSSQSHRYGHNESHHGGGHSSSSRDSSDDVWASGGSSSRHYDASRSVKYPGSRSHGDGTRRSGNDRVVIHDEPFGRSSAAHEPRYSKHDDNRYVYGSGQTTKINGHRHGDSHREGERRRLSDNKKEYDARSYPGSSHY